MESNKIAVYIDNVLREPNIEGALIGFFDLLSKELSKDEEPGEMDYWGLELRKAGVYEFYIKLFDLPHNEEKMNKINLGNLKEYFFNEDHYNRFMQDSSFILFATGQKKYSEIYDYFNLISQKVNVELVDLQISKKQSKHTLHFLSKFFINFSKLIITTKEIDGSEYLYVFKNFKLDKGFNSEFVLEKLKEIECGLNNQ